MLRYIEKVLNENIDKLQNIIGYTFKDRNNIVLALTHSSFANENKTERLSSNERLEFLGDAVLNIVISEYIYRNREQLSEGEMTKIRASIVCESSLMKCANAIELGKYLLLGKGEEITGGRFRTSILSDAFEALIGSIYLDSGLEQARGFIYSAMNEILGGSKKDEIFMDYKTQLQEIIQKNSELKVQYEILEEKGPDHNKHFVVCVRVAEKELGIGEGRSKKEAEQNAARVACGMLLGNPGQTR